MKIIVTKNYEMMSKEAAKLIAAQVIRKPDAVLGLATGSTPMGMYKELVHLYDEEFLDFSKVKTFNLDEYAGLSGDHQQSFCFFMHRYFFDHINIDRQNIHLIPGVSEDPEKAKKNYLEQIEASGGIDMQILGIGLDGHIGFNEPACEFSKGMVTTDLDESTINANARFFSLKEEVPGQAYTLGIQTIMMAEQIVLMASGRAKAEIMKEALFGPIRPQIPASALQLHKHVTVIVDEDAGKLL